MRLSYLFRLSLISGFAYTLYFTFFPSSIRAQIPASQAHVVYTYPTRNAVQVSAKTTIGIRYSEQISRPLLASSDFAVTGTASGIHNGKVILAFDGRTVIFTPENFFSAGEKVTVSINSLRCAAGRMTEIYTFTFQISKSKVLPSASAVKEDPDLRSEPWLSFNEMESVPSDFPVITFSKINDPAPGDLYLTNFKYTGDQYGTFLMILDSQGNPISQHRNNPRGTDDFRPQANGRYTYFDLFFTAQKFLEVDSNYIVVDTFAAGNGFRTDTHELRILPNGGYILLGQDTQMVDMRKINSGGDSNAIVLTNAIQEFDSAKNLIFEWRTADHFPITDATHEDFTLATIDAVHCNSVEYDDTSFLLSSRSLDEITKISRETGNIIWRLGGKHNQFRFLNDTVLFSEQHDIRRLPNGHITLFDNGDFHNTPTSFSRAVEYSLDENAKTITKVWEYRHDPDIYSPAMGSVQRLSNGNTLIGWGICDSLAASEVKPDGSTAFDMRLPLGHYNYRMYKFTKDQFRSEVKTSPRTSAIDLQQNYPNPFTASSIIRFTASERSPVKIEVYDLLGRMVKTLFEGTVDAGEYSANFDGGNFPNGIYICKLSTPASSLSRTMIISK